jgi:uncharacterized protein
MKDVLRLRVDDLPDAGIEISVGAGEFDAALKDVADLLAATGRGAASATLSVRPHPDRVEVDGRAEARFDVACDRCLDPVAVHLDRAIRQVLLRRKPEHPEGKSPKNQRQEEAEIELLAVDLDASDLVGDELDLGELIREELLLAAPSKSLCRPDCKGLCGGCGAELNREPCRCAPPVDGRWKALAALKAKG